MSRSTALAVAMPGVDPVTLMFTMIPLLILFEMSIWLAVFFDRRWQRAADAREAAFEAGRVKVVLPDKSELELPDGASGLDAARAIGPKLAEQAVLVRSNGHVQDLRLPLADGGEIEILTTRNRDDPDALYVLRHSAAHLLAEAVRRLYPGVKIAIGPPIENGFYYDFEFPEPIHESDLERIEEEIRRELEEGREWQREETSRDAARERFAAEGETYKVELVDTAEGDISLYTQGEFTDLCRGPHLQDSKPIKALKLTGLAGAYWRGDEKNTQLTRIYGTAFYSQEDLDAYLERLEEAKRRDHRKLGQQLDLFHLDDSSPGMPFWHPKGMVLWNILEDLRRRENAKRGYVEVKTPLMYDTAVWITSGPLGEVPRRHVPRALRRGADARPQADELPRPHAAVRLRPAELPRPAVPLRGVVHAAPQRARGHAPRPAARPARHTGRRAHLLLAGADRGGDLRLPRLRRLLLRPLRHDGSLRAVDAAGEQARHRRGVGLHRGRTPGGARAARDRVHGQRGGRRVLRARRSTST